MPYSGHYLDLNPGDNGEDEFVDNRPRPERQRVGKHGGWREGHFKIVSQKWGQTEAPHKGKEHEAKYQETVKLGSHPLRDLKDVRCGFSQKQEARWQIVPY